ncbi:signal peptidase II [Candidatus Pacearchaeota archaeon]|nr:signal peptidase II [Candidatus Pacearchaeota archaeon]
MKGKQRLKIKWFIVLTSILLGFEIILGKMLAKQRGTFSNTETYMHHIPLIFLFILLISIMGACWLLIKGNKKYLVPASLISGGAATNFFEYLQKGQITDYWYFHTIAYNIADIDYTSL